MTDTTGPRPAPQRRGKGFPVTPLSEAVAGVQAAGMYGTAHNVEAFAGYLGHNTTKSGAFLAKIAALKDWGLITRRGDVVELSDIGQRLAHPTSEDEASASLREAFFSAQLFADLYEQSAKGRELSLDLLGNRAVQQHGVAAKSKSRFVHSFSKSAAFAGLAELPSSGLIRFLAPHASAEAGEAEENRSLDAPEQLGTAEPVIARTPPPSEALPPTLHQEWPVSGGTLVFEARLERPMPAATFRDLAAIFEAIEKLVKALGTPEPEPEHGAQGAEDAAA